jgi:hypothetical protein
MMSSKEIVGSITRAIAHAMPRRLTGMISALVVSFAFLLCSGVSSIASGKPTALRAPFCQGLDTNVDENLRQGGRL